MSQIFFFHALLLFSVLLASNAQERLRPDEFNEGLQNGDYNAIIDVRNEADFLNGHIPGATYIDGLSRMSLPPFPELLQEGCNNPEKVIVIYCYSGGRAGSVIQKLIDAGYQATLINGQGVSQWTNAGYGLVTSNSTNPRCFDESSNLMSDTDLESTASSPVSKDVTSSVAVSYIGKYWVFNLVYISFLLHV